MGSRAGCDGIAVTAGAGGDAGDMSATGALVAGTVSLTICGAGVATGDVPVDPVPVHPLKRTIPMTRTVKIPVAFRFFIVCSSDHCLYSRKYAPVMTDANRTRR